MKKIIAAFIIGISLNSIAFAESKVMVFNDSNSSLTFSYCIFHPVNTKAIKANVCEKQESVTLPSRGNGQTNYKEFTVTNNTYGIQILDAKTKYGATDFTMKHCQTVLMTDDKHPDKWNAISLDDHGGPFTTCAFLKYTPQGEN